MQMSTKNRTKKGLVLSGTNFVTFADVDNKVVQLWAEFGRAFQIERERAGLTQEDVGKRTNYHVKTISRIENGTPTKRDTVITLAKTIGWDEEKALEKAGFLTRAEPLRKPQNPAEFMQALYKMGFEIQFAGDLSDLGPDDLQDLLDDIYAKLLFKTQTRKKEK